MKIFLIAIAATFAVPAAAQPAPMPQHQQHQDHQQHQPAQAGQPPMNHDRHPGQAMDDCCQDRNGNGVMDCCEGMEPGDGRDCCRHGAAVQAAPQTQQPPQGHQNH